MTSGQQNAAADRLACVQYAPTNLGVMQGRACGIDGRIYSMSATSTKCELFKQRLQPLHVQYALKRIPCVNYPSDAVSESCCTRTLTDKEGEAKIFK